jgi:gliding motility-associated-like protein
LLNNSGQNVADFYSVSSNGCDSVSTLNLKIIQGQNHSLTINSCGPLAFEGNIYGQSTNLQDTVLSIFGCDSLYRNIAIIIHPLPNPINVFIDTVGCGYLTFKDKIYRTSTNLVDTLLNQNNCDSAYIHYQIIVYPNSQPKKLSETISDCYVVNFEGHSYFRDTTIIMLLKTTLGCDSILRTSNIVIQELDLELYSNPPEPVIGDYITLTTKASVPYSILGWLPSSRFPDQTTDIQSLIIQQKDSFGVIGQSENGCIDTAYIYLKPDSLTPVALMPNAFSPNGDGLNDEFKPFFVSKSGYVIKRFQIFDRWGKLVYKASNTKNASWNGRYGNKDREATVGAYFYYIDIEFIDNTKASFKGEINLIK